MNVTLLAPRDPQQATGTHNLHHCKVGRHISNIALLSSKRVRHEHLAWLPYLAISIVDSTTGQASELVWASSSTFKRIQHKHPHVQHSAVPILLLQAVFCHLSAELPRLAVLDWLKKSWALAFHESLLTATVQGPSSHIPRPMNSLG